VQLPSIPPFRLVESARRSRWNVSMARYTRSSWSDIPSIMRRVQMRRFLLLAFGLSGLACASDHYLFAWTGDEKKEGNDFLAVIDANPDSSSYGKLVASVGTDQKTVRIHHT